MILTTAAYIIIGTSLFLILYVHFFHPVLLIIIGRMRRPFVKSATTTLQESFTWPSITILICAYNEQNTIKRKIVNTLAIDYPRDKSEIIIFSDGSSDQTVTIVKGFISQGVKLYQSNQRLGKTACQNVAVKKAAGDIIIFSDATTFYQEDTVKHLIAPFSDPEIGGVIGKIVFETPNQSNNDIASEERFHIRFLQWMKYLENRATMPVGASGAIFAIRKQLVHSIPANAADDLIRPLEVIRKGYRVVFEPKAIAFEPFIENYKEVGKKKKRSAQRAVLSLRLAKELLNPFKYGLFSIQLLTKVLLRRLLFPCYVCLLLSSILLLYKDKGEIYFFITLVFIIVGILVLLSRWKTAPKMIQNFLPMGLCNLLFYYFIVIYNAFVGILLGVLGKNVILWNPARRDRS